MQPVLILNPVDGKVYDFAPLFTYLAEERTSLEELSQRFKSAGDAIPQFYDPENTGYFMDMQDSAYLQTFSLSKSFSTKQKKEQLWSGSCSYLKQKRNLTPINYNFASLRNALFIFL